MKKIIYHVALSIVLMMGVYSKSTAGIARENSDTDAKIVSTAKIEGDLAKVSKVNAVAKNPTDVLISLPRLNFYTTMGPAIGVGDFSNSNNLDGIGIYYELDWLGQTPTSVVLTFATNSTLTGPSLVTINLPLTAGTETNGFVRDVELSARPRTVNSTHFLTEFTVGSTYHFRITAISLGGTSIIQSQGIKYCGTPKTSAIVTAVTTNSANIGMAITTRGSTITTSVMEYSTQNNNFATNTFSSQNISPVTDVFGNAFTTVTGLLPSTTYYYRGRTQSADFPANQFTNTGTFTTRTLPPLLTNFTLASTTINSASFTFNLNWNGGNPFNASLQYSLTSDFSGTVGEALSSSASGNFSLGTGAVLITGSTYYVRIKAQNTVGDIVYTANTITVIPRAKQTITNPTATLLSGTSAKIDFSVNWNGSTPTNLYIQYADNVGYSGGSLKTFNFTPLPTASGAQTATLTGLGIGTYYYRVVAESANFSAEFTLNSNSFTIEPLPITSILDVSRLADRTKIRVLYVLNWNDGTGSTLKLQYATTSDFSGPSFQSVDLNINAVGVQDAPISNALTNSNYYIRLVATNTTFGQTTSNASVIEPLSISNLLAVPTFASGVASAAVTFDVNLNGNTATSIKLQYSNNEMYTGASFREIDFPINTAGSNYSTTLTGLTQGVLYYFRVKVARPSLADLYSVNPSQFFTNAPSLVNTTVINTSSTSVTVSYNLNWNGVAAGTVRLQYATDANFTASLQTEFLATTRGNRTAIISGLTAGTTYYIRLIARNSENSVSSSQTMIIKAKEPALLPTISELTATATSNSSAIRFYMAWNNSTPTGLKIEYATNSQYTNSLTYDFTPLPNADKYQTTTITGLLPNSTYYYKVTASSTEFSPVVSNINNAFNTLPPPPPTITLQTPSIISTTEAAVTFTINSSNINLNGFCVVEFNTTGDFNKPGRQMGASFIVNQAQTVNLMSLTPNITYYYRIKFTDFSTNTISFSTVGNFVTQAPTSVENSRVETFKAYPNPAKDVLNVTEYAELFDVNGIKVAEGIEKIDLSKLPTGLYVAKAKGKMYKVLKE